MSWIHGQVVDALDRQVVPTIHPSAVLRAGERRDELRAQLTADLTIAADLVVR